jgi:hypothetical protein
MRAPVLLILLILTLFTLASEPARGVDAYRYVPGLGSARLQEDGLFAVRIPGGGILRTHGLDYESHAPAGTAGYVPERPPLCSDSDAQHVLYGHPLQTLDRSLLVAEEIEAAIFRANAIIDREARESGGRHADLHVVCDQSGEIAIGSFVNAGPADFAGIVAAARAAGFDRADVDYAIFYDDAMPKECGTGSYEEDSRPTPDNANNRGGGYAVIYSDCWEGSIPLHEIGHTQGAVQPDSPHSTGRSAHCRDEYDVMCYSDGGDRDTGTFERCTDREHFDCGHDDYFDVGAQAGEYLSGHWNLGSPANRFITLGDPASADEPEPAEEEIDLGPVEASDPPVLIVRVARIPDRRSRVRVSLACPIERASECVGTARVRDRAGRGLSAPARYAIAIGQQSSVRLRLHRRALRALTRRGALRLVATTVDAATAEHTKARASVRAGS